MVGSTKHKHINKYLRAHQTKNKQMNKRQHAPKAAPSSNKDIIYYDLVVTTHRG